MSEKTVSRRAFVLSGLGLTFPEAFARTLNFLPSRQQMTPAASLEAPASPGKTPKRTSKVVPMLYGLPRPEIDLEQWFASMKRWGVQRWMSYGLPDYPYYDYIHSGKAIPETPQVVGVPFLEDAWPGFRSSLDLQALAKDEAFIRKFADLSASNGIEFWYLIPFPLFPSRDPEAVKKAAPEFFRSGRLNLYEPRLAELLKSEIRQIKKALPSVRGLNLWLSEGSGALTTLTREDLRHNVQWEEPIIQAFDEVTRELDIKGDLFSHHFLQTVGTRRNLYKMVANFPELIVMENPVWPEEDMLHPFLGFLPKKDRELLFQTNPVALDILIDTEYIGTGVLPSVYPRWWKYILEESASSGVHMGMGRVFNWDGGNTDVNFNRLNAYMFVRLCYNPDADARQLLGEAAREMFGERIPERLVDILWETEPIIKQVIGINGIDTLNHSNFPPPFILDIVYAPQSYGMKTVDDLFSPPGTRLYPPLIDDLNNLKQWRWQDKTVSQPAETYLAEKQEAIDRIESILPEVRNLSSTLEAHHRKMFVDGYELLSILAKGMKLVVETSALHYQWAHAKTVDDGVARTRFDKLAASFRALAANVPENPFLYKERMNAFAEFIQNDLPRISPRCGTAAT